jgi:hypothetical protein
MLLGAQGAGCREIAEKRKGRSPMSNPVSERGTVRDAIVAYLQNPELLPNLAPLTPGGDTPSSIIPWLKGDVESLSEAMVAANGVAVIVIVSSGREKKAQQIEATLECPVVILITENVTENQNTAAGGTGLSADYIAEQVLAALKDWQVPGTNYLVVPSPDAETIVDGTPVRSLFVKEAQSAFYTQIVNLHTRVDIPARTTP